MSVGPFHCSICNHPYKLEKNRDKHELICGLMRRSKSEIEYDNSIYETMPSQKEMYMVMMEMLKEYQKTTSKMKELTKWCKVKKKKLNVIDWLFANYTPKDNFRTFVDSIQLDIDDLNIVLRSNLVDGIFEIMKMVFDEYENSEIPIKAFDQKKNQLFVYVKKKWEPISSSDLSWFVEKMKDQLALLYEDWHQENLKKMNKCQAQDLYIEKLANVNGKTNQHTQLICGQIVQKIYNEIKLNLSNIVEYEFTND
jgi:hypothetical protein